MNKVKFIKKDPIGSVIKDNNIFTLYVGKTLFSARLAIKNYWLLYGKENLIMQINFDTDKLIIQELMRYPFKIEIIGEAK